MNPGNNGPVADSLGYEELSFGGGHLDQRPAQATAAIATTQESLASLHRSIATHGEAATGAEDHDQAMAQVSRELAGILSRSLASAFQSLRAAGTEEQNRLSEELREQVEQGRRQQEQVEAAMSRVVELQSQVAQLGKAVGSEAESRQAGQAKTDHLAADLESLRQAGESQSSELANVRENLLVTFKSLVTETHERLIAVGERLDRQANAIRSILDSQKQREAELASMLTRLRGEAMAETDATRL